MAHREAACNGFVNRRAAKQQRVAQLDSDRWLRKKQDELARPSAAKKVLLLELLLFAPGAAPSPSVEPLGWSLLGFALLLAQPGSSPLDEAPLGAQRQLEHGAPGASKDAAVARSSLASRRSFRPPLGGEANSRPAEVATGSRRSRTRNICRYSCAPGCLDAKCAVTIV
jgi:hypothetical protein